MCWGTGNNKFAILKDLLLKAAKKEVHSSMPKRHCPEAPSLAAADAAPSTAKEQGAPAAMRGGDAQRRAKSTPAAAAVPANLPKSSPPEAKSISKNVPPPPPASSKKILDGFHAPEPFCTPVRTASLPPKVLHEPLKPPRKEWSSEVENMTDSQWQAHMAVCDEEQAPVVPREPVPPLVVELIAHWEEKKLSEARPPVIQASFSGKFQANMPEQKATAAKQELFYQTELGCSDGFT